MTLSERTVVFPSAQKEGLHAVPVGTAEEEPIISGGRLPAAEAALDQASQ